MFEAELHLFFVLNIKFDTSKLDKILLFQLWMKFYYRKKIQNTFWRPMAVVCSYKFSFPVSVNVQISVPSWIWSRVFWRKKCRIKNVKKIVIFSVALKPVISCIKSSDFMLIHTIFNTFYLKNIKFYLYT